MFNELNGTFRWYTLLINIHIIDTNLCSLVREFYLLICYGFPLIWCSFLPKLCRRFLSFLFRSLTSDFFDFFAETFLRSSFYKTYSFFSSTLIWSMPNHLFSNNPAFCFISYFFHLLFYLSFLISFLFFIPIYKSIH